MPHKFLNLFRNTIHSSLSFGMGLSLFFLSLGCADSDDGSTPQQKKQDPLENFQDISQAKALYAKQGRNLKALQTQGKALLKEIRAGYSCANCHRYPENPLPTTGPSLELTAQRYTRYFGDSTKARVWLHNKILSADDFPGLSTPHYSKGLMPKMRGLFKPKETEAIVEYLMSLDS